MSETERACERPKGPQKGRPSPPNEAEQEGLDAVCLDVKPAPDPLQSPVLVLNRNYMPVRITTSRHAFELLFLGRALALDRDFVGYKFTDWMALPAQDADFVGTARGPIRVPRLVVLSHYSRTPRFKLRLTRQNVFRRDDYTCQYCQRQLPAHKLSLDHVVPRSRGGPSSWENLTTSCYDCNRRKGPSMPNECGMQPRARPVRPNWLMVLRMRAQHRQYDEWAPFLEPLKVQFGTA